CTLPSRTGCRRFPLTPCAGFGRGASSPRNVRALKLLDLVGTPRRGVRCGRVHGENFLRGEGCVSCVRGLWGGPGLGVSFRRKFRGSVRESFGEFATGAGPIVPSSRRR